MFKAFNKFKSHNKKINNSKKPIDDNLIQLHLAALDEKNKAVIEFLCNLNNKNNIKYDIVYEIYNKNELNSERLQFIIETCTAYLNISSSLIKKLMKNNDKELLEILFNSHLKFFDVEFILNLLKYYGNKTPISDTELYSLINNDKYKISTEWNENFNRYHSSYYLFNACKSGNAAAVKFLLEHGADLKIKDKNNSIALASACNSGNLQLVKYLVYFGADVHNVNNLGETHLFDACHSGNLNLVKYLVERGADIHKTNNKGETPLSIANKDEHEDIEKYLYEVDASRNKKREENIKERGDLVIAFNDFYGTNSEELTLYKNDFLIVTNWSIKEGWATGYKINNPFEKGDFPSTSVRKYFENIDGLYS